MGDKNSNTFKAKVQRTLTSILPIAKNRKGKCAGCGGCCKLPNVCPFLRYKPNGKSHCSVYPLRPLNCRKYPRTEAEHITEDVCGIWFE